MTHNARIASRTAPGTSSRDSHVSTNGLSPWNARGADVFSVRCSRLPMGVSSTGRVGVPKRASRPRGRRRSANGGCDGGRGQRPSRTSGLACGSRNQPPEAVGTLAPLTIGVDEGEVTVEVSGVFRDMDGDRLTFGASSSVPSVVTVGCREASDGYAGGGRHRAGDGDRGRHRRLEHDGQPVVRVTVYRAFTDHPIVPGVTPVRRCTSRSCGRASTVCG